MEKIVFTTRSRNAAGGLTQSSKLELGDMGKAEAKRLLAQRVSNQALFSDTQAVDDLQTQKQNTTTDLLLA